MTRLEGMAAAGAVAMLVAILPPAVLQARQAARKVQSLENLGRIARALLDYRDVHGRFPPAVVEEAGVARSWRVEILPFLGAAELRERYRTDEPWDGEDNRRVLADMPVVFRDPSDPSRPTSTSYYFVLAGRSAFGTPFDRNAGQPDPERSDAPDGLSQTLLVAEARRDVPWTKPEDVAVEPSFDPASFGRLLGGNHAGGFLAAFGDGAARFVSREAAPAVLEELVAPAGASAGEPTPAAAADGRPIRSAARGPSRPGRRPRLNAASSPDGRRSRGPSRP